MTQSKAIQIFRQHLLPQTCKIGDLLTHRPENKGVSGWVFARRIEAAVWEIAYYETDNVTLKTKPVQFKYHAVIERNKYITKKEQT